MEVTILERTRKESVSSVDSDEIDRALNEDSHLDDEDSDNSAYLDSKELLETITDLSKAEKEGHLHTAVRLEDVELCKALMISNPELVQERNTKQETALHLAARVSCSFSILKMILHRGADCNAVNKWGQTPLHYAAEARLLPAMKQLLKTPNIEVNKKDINGYTALHTFVESSQKFDKISKKGFEMLIKANADINSQTAYGHSVLHLVSYKDEDDQPNSAFLAHLIERYPQLNFDLKSIMGENFLHVYCKCEIGKYVLRLLENLSDRIVSRLFNDFDAFGGTPWSLMYKGGEAHIDDFEKMIRRYNIDFRTSDKLGNTGMHQLADTYVCRITPETFEKLSKADRVDINACNVFGQSPAFLIKDKDVLNLFAKVEARFDMKDRWGRTPLMCIIGRNPEEATIDKVALQSGVEINAKDNNNSTPLHFAVYHGFEDKTKQLLALGADKQATDIIGDRPIDTAMRHSNQTCFKLLTEENKLALSTAENPIESYLFCKQTVIEFTTLCDTRRTVSDILGAPSDIKAFTKHLLGLKHVNRSEDHQKEAVEIVDAVTAHVQLICDTVASYDERFKMTIFPTGSSEEGTKVGKPDEFDFVLILENLSHYFDIESGENCAFLKHKDECKENTPFLSFVDAEDYFIAHPFLNYLLRYFKSSLNERHIWEKGNLYYLSEGNCVLIKGKPVFNFNMSWMGSKYKQLKISVDLVPAVYKPGWWPDFVNPDNIPLANEFVKSSGCFVLLQMLEVELDINNLQNSIGITVNGIGKDVWKRRSLRISVAPAEIRLMKTLPEIFRKGYALAKIIKGNDVCPCISMDRLPAFGKVDYNSRPKIDPSDVIKSYMLKNCTFYVAEKMIDNLNKLTEPDKVAIRIYEHLLEGTGERNADFMKTYFPSYSDMFAPTNFEQSKGLTDRMRSFCRQTIIRTILGILGAPSFKYFQCTSSLPLQYVPFSYTDNLEQVRINNERTSDRE